MSYFVLQILGLLEHMEAGTVALPGDVHITGSFAATDNEETRMVLLGSPSAPMRFLISLVMASRTSYLLGSSFGLYDSDVID